MLKAGNATVSVSDYTRALDFYTKTLGLPLKYRMDPHWAEVGTDGVTIGIHPRTPDMPVPTGQGGVSVGFIVDKIEAAMAQLRERGVSFQGEVCDGEFVKLALFADPDGNPLYLCEVKPAAVSAGECCGTTCATAKPAKMATITKPTKASAKKKMAKARK